MLESFHILLAVYEFFRGYKTYIAGAGMIFIGLGGWLINCVVPFLDAGNMSLIALQAFWNASTPFWFQIATGGTAIGFRDKLSRL